MAADPLFTLRTPTPEDAPGIADAHTRTWRETYTGLVPGHFFEGAAQERREQMWSQVLADPRDRERTRVADVDGAIVGFANAGQPEESSPARPLALHTLYVLKTHHGTGIGQALLEAVLGVEPAQLWVAEANPRAIRFYERNGFRRDGCATSDTRRGHLREIRMVR